MLADLLLELLLIVLVLDKKLPLLEGSIHSPPDDGQVEWLGDVVAGAEAQTIHSCPYVENSGNHDDGSSRVLALDEPEQLGASHARHHYVAYDQGEVCVLYLVERIESVFRSNTRAVFVGQMLRQDRANVCVVVHNQYLNGIRFAR